MSFQIFSQRDPRWAGHALGSGAGELGPYGCLETCFTMVAYDAYPDMHYTPPEMDDVLNAAHDFSGDLLSDNALDRVWPDRFSTHTESGFNQAHVNAAIAAPDEYAIIAIHNPAVGVPGTHFMVMYSGSTVADPWWGKVMTLATWGGPGIVLKTIYVKILRAQHAANVAATQAQAAAAAKAAADAAAAKAAAEAAAKAKADADAAAAQAAAQAAAEEAARQKAAADKAAADAAAKAAADAAAAAAAATPKVTPPTAAPKPDFWAYLQTFVILLVKSLRSGR